jgi:energy-coupling factor transporter ATP-binding protein EcfA2
VITGFPEGYDTLVGEKGVTLSGGQKQRITIARTLLKDPRILIFDDAVSAVDTETEAHIHAALEQLAHGRTTFIIAHRIQTVMRADLILVLDKGRIIQHGTHADAVAPEGNISGDLPPSGAGGGRCYRRMDQWSQPAQWLSPQQRGNRALPFVSKAKLIRKVNQYVKRHLF